MEVAMNNKENNYSDILFGYMNTPFFGEDGDDGGFSIAIYPDGKLIYKTYLFGEIEETRREFKLNLETVKDISKGFSFYKQEINELDDEIDNDSLDGCENIFIFNGKKIITRNIQYLDEDEMKEFDPEYYKEYLPVIKQQNMIIEIFAMVSVLLEIQGIDLLLHEVNFNEED